MADRKRLEFLEESLAQLREFPEAARKEAGVQLHEVQQGIEPNDLKPMTTVGPGVREIRIRDEAGAFRAPYIADVAEALYVLHAFQNKTRQTAKRDLDLAAARLRDFQRRGDHGRSELCECRGRPRGHAGRGREHDHAFPSVDCR